MKKGELTRQHIIEKAAPVFNRRGFAGCSMQDLMEATGLEKGGIYRHFASKEELAIESFKYAFRQLKDARMGGAEELRGAIPRLRHFVQAFARVPSPVPGGCPLVNASSDAENSCKTIRTMAKEGLGAWKSEIREILEEGIRSGEIREDVEPRRTANALISMLEGALVISRLEGNREALHDAQVSLEELLMTLGVSAKGSSAGKPGLHPHSPETTAARQRRSAVRLEP